ncbi:MAG: hypothetical protein H6711_33280 [Myxococcales bacterium]|nr:hypothetical protein [Myxococcales bacterium]
MSVLWAPPGGSADKPASVRFRPQGSMTWRDGLPLWFDGRDAAPLVPQYRGSLVHLEPGTTYEIEVSAPGIPTEMVVGATWSEAFPIAETIELPAMSSDTLIVDKSGSPDGYILYTGPGDEAVIDVGGALDHNVEISASYVILRGLTLRNAATDAITITDGDVHDVVIERCDISGWGELDDDGFGVDYDAAIQSKNPLLARLIVQRNRIHDPRGDTNSWWEPVEGTHPGGPQATSLTNTAGNHVFRYNEITSTEDRYYNDAIGGGDNFSYEGFPNRDSDIYGNYIARSWDNPIEAEGANNNVRIWGNYIEDSYTPVSIAATSVGPIYIWRNVTGRSRIAPPELTTMDDDPRGRFLKAGNSGEYQGGRVYVFHNTLLQPPPEGGMTLPQGVRSGVETTASDGGAYNIIARNNIFHVFDDGEESVVDDSPGVGIEINDFDYDLYNGAIESPLAQEQSGFVGEPVYDPGNAAGEHFLDPSSLGFDAGQVLANFNDDFQGAGPDVGAYEAGRDPLEFGVDAYESSGGESDGTTSGGGETTGGGGSSTGASSTGAGTSTGASGGSDGSGGSGGTATGATATSGALDPDGDSGCGCRALGDADARGPAWLLAGLLALGRRRARRRRGSGLS